MSKDNITRLIARARPSGDSAHLPSRGDRRGAGAGDRPRFRDVAADRGRLAVGFAVSLPRVPFRPRGFFAGDLRASCASILADHPREVDAYVAGRDRMMKFFVGTLMKATKGRADAAAATAVFRALIDEHKRRMER